MGFVVLIAAVSGLSGCFVGYFYGWGKGFMYDSEWWCEFLEKSYPDASEAIIIKATAMTNVFIRGLRQGGGGDS